MWTCPACGRSFRNTQQRHHCERTTAEEQLKSQPEVIVQIYQKIISAVETLGPYTKSPIKDYIMLKNRSTFLTIKPRKKYLDITFFLDFKTEDFPIFKSLVRSKTRVIHAARLESPKCFRIGKILDQKIISINSRRMISRESLIKELSDYQSVYSEEMVFRQQFLELLAHPRCFHRDFLPGHITGSAWITDEKSEHVLLTHHAKLNKWLQPGGHADGDENVMRVALREAEEETGLKKFKILDQESIFDIDIHTIPARKDFPEHLHYDVRVWLIADMKEELQITEESHDLRWVRLDDLESLTNNSSLIRVREKSLK